MAPQEVDRERLVEHAVSPDVHIHATSNSIASALDRLRDQAHVTSPAEFAYRAVVVVIGW